MDTINGKSGSANEKELPTIIVTGASGFIGRNLLTSIKENYRIFAMARRSRKEADVPFHHNIHWIQCDISNKAAVENVKKYIVNEGGGDYLVHLAAYYDFKYKDNPEYHRTNIIGTRNILEMAGDLSLKRFVFVSSLAACNFPEKNLSVSERTAPVANFAYAKSKKKGEEMVREYSEKFPSTVVRLAAVYSDWCEFPPLYKFLTNWLAGNWDSRFLGGKGESAITYLHINDLLKLFVAIFNKTDELRRFDIYNASPDGSTSHKDLFEVATNYYYGKSIKTVFVPRLLTYPGLVIKNLISRILHPMIEPFETFWMIKYIDRKLEVNSKYTQNTLEWEPARRYHVLRRLLFLLEKRKSHPDEWKFRNEATLKRTAHRPNIIIYEQMMEEEEYIITQVKESVFSVDNKKIFERYSQMEEDDLNRYLSNLYHLLMAVVRSGDRSLLVDYIDDISLRRFAQGFKPEEICSILMTFNDIIVNNLTSKSNLQRYRQEINDYVSISLQIASDEIEDLYEKLDEKIRDVKTAQIPYLQEGRELEHLIEQLAAFYQVFPEEQYKKAHKALREKKLQK